MPTAGQLVLPTSFGRGATTSTSGCVSESERRFGAALEASTGIVFEHNVRPLWLLNPVTGYPLELDLFCKARHLAIEYDGPHHHQFPNAYHATREEYDAQRERDVVKSRLCAELGIRLVRVQCGESTDAEVVSCVALLSL